MPFEDMSDDVQADYERLSAGGQTPAVLLGPASGSHSAEQLAKVQEARAGIGLAPLSPFEAFSFLNGTPGSGTGPDTHHARDDADFSFDAPGGHAGDLGKVVHHGQDPDRIRTLSNGNGGTFTPDPHADPRAIEQGSPISWGNNIAPIATAVPTGGANSSGFALVDHGLGPHQAQLVEVFRQLQQPDDAGKTNTALVIDLWCLLDSGEPGTPIPTGTRKAWGRVNFPCKLIACTVLADPSGDVTLDVQKTDYATFPTFTSIVGATPPMISGGQKTLDADLTDWTVLLSRGDIIRVDLPTNTAADLILLDLAAVRTDASDKTTGGRT